MCEAAPITRGAYILVIKGVYIGRVCGHIGQIRKITEILENRHLDGPWVGAGAVWGLKTVHQGVPFIGSLGGRGRVRFRAQTGGVFRTVFGHPGAVCSSTRSTQSDVTAAVAEP